MNPAMIRESLPRHRAAYRPESYPTQATCTCVANAHTCPRHRPEAYAESMALHATDSI